MDRFTLPITLRRRNTKGIDYSQNRFITQKSHLSSINFKKLENNFSKTYFHTRFKRKIFFQKYFEILWLIEEGFTHQNPYQIINHVFNEWHFQPLDLSKPQLFYENILIEIGSVILKHFLQKKSKINHTIHLSNIKSSLSCSMGNYTK